VTYYRKKSEPVEARQWTGYSAGRMREWLGYACVSINSEEIIIENRSGRVIARLGDWIVHEDDGFYPTEHIKFHAEYEAVT
jgi:hypothetical protein